MGVEPSTPPPDWLLSRYTAPGRRGDEPAYVDCFRIDIDRLVSNPEFVTAFYTTWLFRLERIILRYLLKLPSSDAGAAAVAFGETDRFAAWSVEARTPDQLLMCAVDDRTRSWFMTVADDTTTRLYFGSAVLPAVKPDSDRATLDGAYRWALGLHRLYSRLLLGAAHRKLNG